MIFPVLEKVNTVHCSGERTWFQNTDEKIQNLYFEEDFFTLKFIPDTDVQPVGSFYGKQTPQSISRIGCTIPYKTTVEILDYNEDQVPDRVMLFSGLGLLFIEGIRP